jgi:hypothetical protein
MRATSPPIEPEARSPDEWVTSSPRLFRLLFDHDPPRPYSYTDQLREDARDSRCVVLWLTGTGFIILALATSLWFVAPVGVWLLLWYLLMLRTMVGTCKETPLYTGIVEKMKGRHWLLFDVSLAQVRLPNGQTVTVAVSNRLVGPAIEQQGRVEVMFLYDPKAAYSMMIAARPII